MNKRFKHRNFDYVPRFYDPEKEEREARLAKYKGDKDNPEMLKTRIRGSFSKPIGRSYQSDGYRKAVQKSNKIVLFVLLTLILVVFYFMMEYFPKMVEAFD